MMSSLAKPQTRITLLPEQVQSRVQAVFTFIGITGITVTLAGSLGFSTKFTLNGPHDCFYIKCEILLKSSVFQIKLAV